MTAAIDREKTCPMLLRVFWKLNGHHSVHDYSNKDKLPVNEVQIYTWPDATLREIADLLRDVNPDARRRTSRLSFAFVYPDKRGMNVLREVGVIWNNRKIEIENRTLSELKFQTGDYVDLAILV